LLEALFSPDSVAVIGASINPSKLGYVITDNILKYGFGGKVYPINPKEDEILGLTAYPSVTDVPGPVDLAVIAVPSTVVASVMKDCGEKGVRAAIVITAGFRETGAEGRKMEREVMAIAEQYGIDVLGPNCLGLIDTNSSLNASFAASMPQHGEVSFMSQSGALCTGVLDWAAVNHVGFSRFVSLGNKGDLNEVDFIRAWKDDPNTKVVMAYLEGVVDGEAFIEASTELARVKPFVVLKAGTTSAGSRAVSSHTGTLAGSDTAYETAFAKAGILRARSVGDLFAYATALAYQPLPKGRRVAIVTNAGGPGIMATDACEENGLTLPRMSQETVERLREVLPPAAGFYNPVDVLGDALADRYVAALQAVLEDENVDAAIVLLTPQAMTEIKATAQAIVDLAQQCSKPVLASFIGGKDVAAGSEILGRGNVPFYGFPEQAAEALVTMVRYKEWLETELQEPVRMSADRERASMSLLTAKKAGRLKLNEMEARQIMAAYEIPLPKSQLATSAEQAARFASEMGYPVVMKVISPDILHKSDMGGVVVGVDSPQSARQAYQDIMIRARRYMEDADIWGIAVQEQVQKGKEIIIGVNKDPTFGHMIMLGLGGIYVEVLKDVQFGIAPLTPRQARAMITSLRSFPLLAGVRGEESSDIDALEECLLRISQMVTDLPEIAELDINPLFVYPEGKGIIAVDARIVVSADESKPE
jgi:acetyl coenzyme A synthetase (ADP forming)-like protein